MFNEFISKIPLDFTLEEVLKRLANNPQVDGLIVMGSAGNGTATRSSDFDVCVVLSERPAPIWLVLTEVENRVSEFYFITSAFITRKFAEDKIEAKTGTLEATYLQWILTGKIAFDRKGQLKQLRQKLSENYEPVWYTEADLYSKWFAINYNLKETRRLLLSEDPIVRQTITMRTLLYGLPELWYCYFQFQKIAWRGDKEAIKYLTAHDPAFLQLVQALPLEQDIVRKLELYTQIAAIVTEPLGGLWQSGDTAATVDLPENEKEAWKAEKIKEALDFWENLVGLSN